MRIYMNAREAIEEIKRDLSEMGIIVRPSTMQNKDIKGNDDFATQELQNYSYCIMNAKSQEVEGVSQPWADEEFGERLEDRDYFINPGEAYRLRPEIWNEFLNRENEFDYSYNERINKLDQLELIIGRIKEDPDSRQLWLSIWNPGIDPERIGGKKRVPCSLGYNFQVREGKLNIHYLMRSCDFATHMRNDIYLAMRLLEYVAERTGNKVGSFTHTIFSLHVYQKDVQGVF